jgi:muramoyltetrapeptide carboxypeptidase
MEHVNEFDFPVCFNFPAGHINDNQALIFGRKVNMLVEEENVSLTYSESQH